MLMVVLFPWYYHEDSQISEPKHEDTIILSASQRQMFIHVFFI